jgi:hypothetical protein
MYTFQAACVQDGGYLACPETLQELAYLQNARDAAVASGCKYGDVS